MSPTEIRQHKTAQLVLVAGLPASGKTTFAEALAKRIQAHHLNTDIIRIELGLQGQYDPDTKARVYDALIGRAADWLSKAEVVIVDATFFKRDLREPFEALAQQADCPVKWILIQAEETSIRDRMQQKRAYSEADFEVYQKIKAAYDPLRKAHLSLPSDQLSLEDMLERAESYIKARS